MKEVQRSGWVASIKPKKCPANVRWAVLEIGINSVKPCMIPNNIASIILNLHLNNHKKTKILEKKVIIKLC